MLLAGSALSLSIILIIAPPTLCQDSPAPSDSLPNNNNGASGKPICHNHPPEKGPPLPALAEQFEMRIEATIHQKAYTVSMEMNYDYPNNDASLTIIQKGIVSKRLYNFPAYESYFIQNGSCTTEDLRTRTGFHLITFNKTKDGGHISHVDDLLNFGNKYNETYVITNDTVRGMPVDQWTACVEREGMTFRLDYFFTKGNYSNPTGTSPIPVRALLRSVSKTPQSTKDQRYEHEYDFVMYKAGACKNRENYEVPPGVVCKRTQVTKPKITQPTLPDHFSMGVEGVRPESKFVSFSDQYFDYSASLTRTDLTPSSKTNLSQFGGFGDRPLKVIHDYSTGIQYVIDMAEENCSMRAIPNNSLDAVTLRNDSSLVHMRHGADMYRFSKHDLQYQGKRNVRDIECDIWSATRKDWFKGFNTTIESCWAPKREIGGATDDGDLDKQVLVQIRLHNKGDNYSSQYINNVFKYSDAKPDLRVFDIGGCFPTPEEQMHIIFRVKGTMKNVVGHQPHHLQVAVRDAVSKAAKIAPIRVNSFFFGESSDDFVDIWMTIYASPNVKGNVDHPVPQVSSSEAYENLEKVINSKEGLTIKLVSITRSKSFKVEKDSLKTDRKVDDPRRPYPLCKSRDGHSSGSMAALGIMMLIVGVVVGLVGAFFLWKRGTGIPYQVQD